MVVESLVLPPSPTLSTSLCVLSWELVSFFSCALFPWRQRNEWNHISEHLLCIWWLPSIILFLSSQTPPPHPVKLFPHFTYKKPEVQSISVTSQNMQPGKERNLTRSSGSAVSKSNNFCATPVSCSLEYTLGFQHSGEHHWVLNISANTSTPKLVVLLWKHSDF